jgi:hypothetical protein
MAAQKYVSDIIDFLLKVKQGKAKKQSTAQKS